jgi:hypothetical protein
MNMGEYESKNQSLDSDSHISTLTMKEKEMKENEKDKLSIVCL